MFDCDDYLSSESDESLPPTPIYDRYQSGNGYHVVPPPYTGKFMPPKPDLVFNNAPNDVETDHPAFNVKLSPTKPNNDLSHTHRPSAPIIEDWVSDSEDKSETKTPQNVPSFVQPTEQVKSPRPSVKHVETSILTANSKTTIPKRTSNGKRRNRKACFVPVTTVVPKINVTTPRQDKPSVTKPNLSPRRYINRILSLKASNFPPKVTAVKAPLVNAAKVVQGKWEWKLKCPVLDHVSRNTSASMTLKRFDYNDALGRSKSGNPQHALKDKGVIDSGCSRHMTADMSYLLDFEELNGGYVAFDGNLKGGKIFRKGKIRTGKLDFDDVYFVKKLKFNLFSVSQMCDKNNNILFTTTECLILSPEFKLPDENQVLLRIPRENNMYNNRVLVTKPQNKTPYELLQGRTPSIGFMKPFGCPVTILNTLDSLGKSDGKNTDEDAAFNEKESEFEGRKPEFEVNVSPSNSAQSKKHDDKTKREAKGKIPAVGQLSLNSTKTFSVVDPSNAAASPTQGKYSCIDTSQLLDNPNMPELEDITYSDDEDDVGVEEELLQFKMQKVWVLVDLPHGKRAICTKWVFRNKKDERGIVVRNKAQLGAFLYETIKEEVYVCQPLGFEDPDYPDKVYKVVKALYGLHQAPRAWYETLANYLLENGFQSDKMDQTLFIKREKDDILLVQIFVDDIIFGSTNKDSCKALEKLMKDKF
nr:putative ribonuclease H-like domain-containing protein [Tanacetum cinerariifolium]